jgi:hypothetical protein
MKLRLAVVLAVFCFCSFALADTMYDLTSPGATVMINGAIFQQGSIQPSGTGQFNSFLRIRANGTEYGYNTDEFPQPPLDIQPGHTWTHSLPLSAVPVFTINGITYYQFMLDINQAQGQGKNLLSLDVLQFYTGTTPSPQCCPPGGDFGAPRYNLDAGSNNYILLDSGLSHGSGSSDMFAYIPTADFAGAGPYLYLYSGFGENNASNGGFEEWGVGPANSGGGGSSVPEPSSVLLLGSGLATLGGTLRRKRK